VSANEEGAIQSAPSHSAVASMQGSDRSLGSQSSSPICDDLFAHTKSHMCRQAGPYGVIVVLSAYIAGMGPSIYSRHLPSDCATDFPCRVPPPYVKNGTLHEGVQ